MKFNQQRGGSLLELVVVVAVGVLVVAALSFATISSLRNSQLAKNQAQATKLAQEGIERVRAMRDRNDDITIGSNNWNWQSPPFWAANSCVSPCYLKISYSPNKLTQISSPITSPTL